MERAIRVDDEDTFRCPACGNEGPEQEAFSYLCVGFNGIRAGDDDDLDCLECGECGEKLDFPEDEDDIP